MNVSHIAVAVASIAVLAILASGGAIVGADTGTNNPATGVPTIDGTAQVHKTLTAKTSGVADPDGIASSSLNYQWFANDGVRTPGNGDRFLGSFTKPEYVVQSRDEGDLIWVQVWFIDGGGTTEFIDSAVTETVTAAANPKVPVAPVITDLRPVAGSYLSLLWKMPLYPYGDGGSVITSYTVQWKEADDSWDDSDDVSEQTTSASLTTGAYVVYSWIIQGLTDGVQYNVRVFATNRVGDGPTSAEFTATAAEELSLVLSGITMTDYVENGTSPVGTYVVSGAAENATITWSLTGTDSGDFSISSSGSLTFSSPPDYESASDSDTNNVYEVTVNASDGTNTATLDVTVTVTDEAETQTRVGGL